MNPQILTIAIFLARARARPALAQASGTIPAGTKIPVVTDQSVSSKTAQAGQTIPATVAQDVTVGGKVVIPKGSAAKLTVSSVQASGRLSTPAKLYLRLRSVTVGGKTYTFATSSAGRTEGGKGKRDAGFIGGGAAGGAIFGAVGGGGKGRTERASSRRGSRNRGRSGDGEERHRVSRRNKAGLHYTGRSGDQLERITGARAEAGGSSLFSDGQWTSTLQVKDGNCRLTVTGISPLFFRKCCL